MFERFAVIHIFIEACFIRFSQKEVEKQVRNRTSKQNFKQTLLMKKHQNKQNFKTNKTSKQTNKTSRQTELQNKNLKTQFILNTSTSSMSSTFLHTPKQYYFLLNQICLFC
jgi:hypothetical protein